MTVEVQTAERLREAYGRDVQPKVKLWDESDIPEDCQSVSGDELVVALPPDDVELDECSLFVWLQFEDGPRRERVYDHEITSI